MEKELKLLSDKISKIEADCAAVHGELNSLEDLAARLSGDIREHEAVATSHRAGHETAIHNGDTVEATRQLDLIAAAREKRLEAQRQLQQVPALIDEFFMKHRTPGDEIEALYVKIRNMKTVLKDYEFRIFAVSNNWPPPSRGQTVKDRIASLLKKFDV